MRPGFAALRILGIGFVAVGLTAGGAVLFPPPVWVVSVTVAGTGDGRVGWAVEASVPRRLLAGRSAPLHVKISPVSAGAGNSDLLVASLAAPGAVVTPPGDQVGPAAGPLGFRWSIRVLGPGVAELTPSLALRSSSTTDRLLWAEPFAVEVWSVFGLGAPQLGIGVLVFGGLGAGMIAAWARERQTWRSRRTD